MSARPYNFLRRCLVTSIAHLRRIGLIHGDATENGPLSQSERLLRDAGEAPDLNWSASKPLLRSYFADWVVTFVLYAAALVCDRIDGFHREFDINDTTIAHAFSHSERVTVPKLLLLAILFPISAILILNTLHLRPPRHGLLALLLSISLATAFTQVTKIAIGRPRPDFLDRCKPRRFAPHAGLVNSSVCSADPESYVLIDGFRSFPSGHSSTAWSGLGFLFLYTSSMLRSFDRPSGSAISAILPAFALALASWISISRTMDYRHHWEDVVGGGVIGFGMAWLSYQMYYPFLIRMGDGDEEPCKPRLLEPSLDHCQLEIESDGSELEELLQV